MDRFLTSYSKLFISAFLLFFMVMQSPVYAGSGLGFNGYGLDTDDNESQLFGFWDLRDRDSFVQITNLDLSAPAIVHVQLFNVADNCTEYDFFDTYTPGDTFVYDVSSLARNDGQNLDPPIYSDSAYGIIAVTVVSAVGGFSTEGDIIGNSRIIDGSGYEYRTNLPGTAGDDNNSLGFNFSSVNGTPQFADVVGFALTGVGQGVNHAAGQGVEASLIQGAAAAFEVTLFDQNEQPLSCDLTAFICAEENNTIADIIGGGELGINFGINDAIVNSKGRPSLCDGTDPVGHVLLEVPDGEFFDGPIIGDGQNEMSQFTFTFVGFTGLNNGSGTATYDSWFAVEGFESNEIE